MQTSRNLAHLVAELPDIGACADVYRELTHALNDPGSSISHFGEIIGKDPILMAKLLRLANSVFFGYPSSIRTLDEALIVIGIQQIRDLVASVAVIEYFKDVSSNWVSMQSFWQHSLACGLAARILAGYRRNWNPEQSFAAGLMHDLGRLVIFIKEPEGAKEIFNRHQENHSPLYQIEREILGYDHAELGGVLLECWSFPLSLINAVRFHHEPLKSTQDPIEAALVHFGDILAHAMELGGSGERCVPLCDEEAWEKVGLDIEILRPSMKEVDRQFEDVVGMFVH